MKEILIQNRKCRIFAESKAEYILIHPTGQHEIDSLETEYEMLKSGTERDFALVSFEVKNWNDELSPWKAKQAFGNELFGDGAEKTLKFITDELIPSLQEYMNHDTKIILGGIFTRRTVQLLVCISDGDFPCCCGLFAVCMA